MRLAAVLSRLFFLTCIVAAISGETLCYTVDSPRPNLRWKTNSITISVSDSLTNKNSGIKYESDTLGALQRSLAAWESVADISFKRIFTKDQSISPAGKSGDGISLITIAQTPENVLLFSRGLDDASAKTRVFYDRTGAITEADIVLNPFLQFSTDGTPGTIDLEAALTHEIGHLLGLDHSTVLGATMYGNYGRNGSSGTRAYPRGLGEEDIAAVRALYGARDDDSCCGRIEGSLLISPARVPAGLFVWAEDFETGRVMAENSVNVVGRFSLGGLSAGKYRLFAQDDGNIARVTASQPLGDVVVEKDQVKTITRRLRLVSSGFDLQYVGLDGVISVLAIPVQQGHVFSVFLGIKETSEKKARISSDSPYVTVLPGSAQPQDYGNDITILNVEVRVDEAAPPGEYSLFAETDGASRRYLVGSLAVRPKR
jgi:Matrixin.